MIIGCTGDIKAVWVVKHFGVAIGRRVKQQDAIILTNLHSVDDDIFCRCAIHVANRRCPAQHLFNGAWQQGHITFQQCKLIWVLQKSRGSRRNHVTSCFISTHKNQHRFKHDVNIGKTFAFPFGVDDQTHEVLAIFATPLIDLFHDVVIPANDSHLHIGQGNRFATSRKNV